VTATPKPLIHEAILQALSELSAEQVPASYTVYGLAHKTGAQPSRIEAELRTMKRAGLVTVRVTKANDVLYKLVDAHATEWAAAQGAVDVPRAARSAKRSRKLGGRKIRITGWC
jgi:DNA-binding IclR family transcriptional regulator